MTVDQATDGREALDLLGTNKYEVVLLDLVMPNIDGIHVLDAIHASPVQPVVLVVTGADRSQLGQLDSGRIHGIVRKPFDSDELGDLVVQCAEIRGRGTFEAMAISTMVVTIPWLSLFVN